MLISFFASLPKLCRRKSITPRRGGLSAVRISAPEALEQRIAPATIVTFNNSTHALSIQGDFVDDGSTTVQAGATEALNIIVGGGELLIADNNGAHVTLQGGGTGLTQLNTSQVQIDLSQLTGPITLDTGTGPDQVVFGGTLTLAADQNFDASSSGRIFLTNGASISTSGAGHLNLTSGDSLILQNFSSLSTVDGNLTISANAVHTATGSTVGVEIEQATVTTTGHGNISITGVGAGATLFGTFGIQLLEGSLISSTMSGAGAGTITLNGTGGNADGVELGAFATGVATNNDITSVSGAIQITGTGGTASAGTVTTYGISIYDGAQVISSGTGANAASITMIGQGGTAGNLNPGISISHFLGPFGTAVTSVDGDISLTGTGGADTGSNNNWGVAIGQGAKVASTGTGNIIITGTAGAGANFDYGVNISGTFTDGTPTVVSVASGMLTVMGTSGDTTSAAIHVAAQAKLMSTGTRGISLTGDTMDLSSTVDAGPGKLSILTLTAGSAIDLGGNDAAGAPGTLGLLASELANLSGASISIGTQGINSGPITISQAVSLDAAVAGAAVMLLTGNHDITFNGGSLDVGTGSLSLMTGPTGGVVTLTAGPHVSVGALSIHAGLDGIGTSSFPFLIDASHSPTLDTASTGDQALSASGGTVTIDATGLDAGTGTIHLVGGLFALGGSERINDATTLEVAGADFNLGAFNETVALAKLSAGSISSTTGQLTSTAQFDFLQGSVSAHLAGTAGLLKEGTGLVFLQAANTYTGGTTISAGTIDFSNRGAFGPATESITLGDTNTGANDVALLATISIAPGNFTNPIVVANQGAGHVTIGTDAPALNVSTNFDSLITLNRATTFQGNNPGNTIFSGAISGNVGTLTISGGAPVAIEPFGSSNSFSGDLAITGTGTTLQIETDVVSLLSATSVDVGAGTTFELAGASGGTASIDALTGAGTVMINPQLTNNPLTLAIGANGGTGTFSGMIKDGGTGSPLTLTSVGTETLSGPLSYTGATVVNNGHLELSGSAFASHTVTVAGGALQIDGANLLKNSAVEVDSAFGLLFGGTGPSFALGELTGTATFDLSIAGTGTNPVPVNLQVGNLNSNFSFGGTLTGTGSLTKIGTGTLTLSNDNFFSGDTNVTAGHIVLDSIDALQGSTLIAAHANDYAFASGHTSFDIGGLKGSAPVVISNQASQPLTLRVGGNDQNTTYSGALSGAGALAKSGNGTLTLTGKNQQALGTLVESGTLVVSSDLNLGKAGVELAFAGGTLSAAKTFTTSRPIGLLSGTDTLAATAGHTLTVKGALSGTGDLGITGAGRVVIVENENSTNSGSDSLDASGNAKVNGVNVRSPGEKGEVMIMPGAMPGDIAMIDLSGATKIANLIISVPKGKAAEVDEIMDMNDTLRVKSITLGKGVTFGNGAPDSTPDLILMGELGSLKLDSVAANAMIELGMGLPYHVTGKNPIDTYHNHPNVTFGNVLGGGVVLDVTGDGTAGGTGGGGLGKVIANTWDQPGTIETTQSIKSIVIRHGNFDGNVLVDPNHLGEFTVADVGSVSIPLGMWTGAGLQVEGVVAQFLTAGIQEGTLIQAGAFGKVTIKGTYAGQVIALSDPAVTTTAGTKTTIIATGNIASVAIAGNFTGLIAADGTVGNVTLTGTAHFMGTLQGESIGNVSAFSYEGNPTRNAMTPRQSITAATTIGTITATGGALDDYIIEAGASLGHDHAFGGGDDSFTGSYMSGTKMLGVHITSVTVKGDVADTTIAAGVMPGGTGLYGSTDTEAAHAVGVIATIGAMKFGATDESVSTAPTMAGATVGNAFEAGALTSILCGTGTHAVTTKTFTATQYLNGADPTVATLIRLI